MAGAFSADRQPKGLFLNIFIIIFDWKTFPLQVSANVLSNQYYQLSTFIKLRQRETKNVIFEAACPLGF